MREKAVAQGGLLFFFLDDNDPVLQVGLELRDYESENGRKQSFSYDVS